MLNTSELLFTTMPAFLLMFQLFRTILFFLPKSFRSLLPESPKDPKNHPKSSQVSSEHSDLSRVFATFDCNGDGRITKEELNESLENLGIFISDSDLTSTIKKVDADGDGCIDAEEFVALHGMIMGGKREKEDEDKDVREAFEVFDENGDGYITVEELRSVLTSLGLMKNDRTVDECRRMIGRVDGDGDGRVSFEEFKEMMKTEVNFS